MKFHNLCKAFVLPVDLLRAKWHSGVVVSLSMFASISCFGALFFAQVGYAQSGALLLDNATVIVGDGQVISPGSVLVMDDAIVAVGTADTLAIPADATVVDLDGKYLLPALIDAHTHLGYQSTQGWGHEFYGRDNLLANLRQYAYYGFSAVFSAGSDPAELGLELQQEFAGLPVARLLFAVGMGPPGQGPNDSFLLETAEVESRLEMPILRGIEGPVQAIALAREVAEQGVPFIKIWVDDRGGSQEKLSPDAYLPLVAEGMRQRLKTFAHQQYAADMLPLIDAGVSGFLHGRLGTELNEEIAAALARERVFTVPNLGLAELRRETIGRDAFLQSVLPEAEIVRLSAETGARQAAPPFDSVRDSELAQSLQRILSAGADIVLGTDAGALPDHPFGYTGHRELEIYVRLGMTPMQAIVAATSNAALHLGQNDLGLVAPGRRADLLVLSANPLENIRNTREIHSVYLGGAAVDREQIAAELSR
jgi:imidazolonepropionase-like amidohydrolase